MTNRIEWSASTRRALLALAGALALAGCGGDKKEVTGFSQADLTGSWDLVQVSTNDGPGWFVASITVASDGKIAVTSNLDSAGNAGLPPPGFDARFTVDAKGNVTLGGADGSPAFHGTLASSKTLVVATDTDTGAVPGYQLIVVRKRVPGVTFGPSDAASLPFALHTLQVGNAIGWQVGQGSTNASGQISVNSLLDSAGSTAVPPPNFDTLQVDANGLVTTVNDTTFHGVMTPDKSAIFAVSTNEVAPPQTHQMLVILRTGRTFAAADLAGAYAIHSLGSGATIASSSWNRGTVTIDAAGQVTFTSFLTSAGSTTLPTGVAFAFDPATGIITRAADPTFHGRLAYGKDFYVRTSGSVAVPSMAVVVK